MIQCHHYYENGMPPDPSHLYWRITGEYLPRVDALDIAKTALLQSTLFISMRWDRQSVCL